MDTESFPGYAVVPATKDLVPVDGMYVILKRRNADGLPFPAKLCAPPFMPDYAWVLINPVRGALLGPGSPATSRLAYADFPRGLDHWFETSQRGKGGTEDDGVPVVSMDYRITHVAYPAREIPNGDHVFPTIP